MDKTGTANRNKTPQALSELFLVSLYLGLTSFGGPVAHIAYFHREYVQKRQWLNDPEFTDLVTLCHFLPGPASSQLGISIGTLRCGLAGGLVAWLGFTLPSAVLLTVFALVVIGQDWNQGFWLHGLKLVALVMVAQAVWQMGRRILNTRWLVMIALVGLILVLLVHKPFIQIMVIVLASLIGLAMRPVPINPASTTMQIPVSRGTGFACLGLALALLAILPWLRWLTGDHLVAMADSFYRAGALVFGGGHVVLPLLRAEVVPTGWISDADFLAGYGAAQAVPGPLFSFAAYLGAANYGIGGAVVALVAIFLPGSLLVVGVLPFWNRLRQLPRVQSAFTAANAAVIGLLLAAWYDPLWTSSIGNAADFALASLLAVMLLAAKLPPWTLVLTGAAGATAIGYLRQ